MRGQAFIVYKELPCAVAAMRALQGYPFFGKALRVQFGRTPSKATVEFEKFAVEPAKQEQTSTECASPLDNVCVVQQLTQQHPF